MAQAMDWKRPTTLPTTISRRLNMNAKRRAAFTLIELLVVVTILVTLIAITLPLAKKLLDDSYTREASRQLNAYFAMAKMQAIRTGRPWGLYMQLEAPLGSGTGPNPLQVTKVYLAEVQPPYAGSTIGAKGEICNLNNVRQFMPVDSSGQPDQTEFNYLAGSMNPSPLLIDGESFIVRFDYKGEWYKCQRTGNQLIYIGTLSGLGYP